jgi:hypothetical protein
MFMNEPGTVNRVLSLQGLTPITSQICTGADDDQESLQDEIVWPHGHLLDYKVVDGKPFVLVPWHPTWEPPDEYSIAEVERVKRRWQSQRRGKGRGRARLGRNRG